MYSSGLLQALLGLLSAPHQCVDGGVVNFKKHSRLNNHESALRRMMITTVFVDESSVQIFAL